MPKKSFRRVSAMGANKEKVGLFPIRQGDKEGFIDRKGKIAINPLFDEVFRFSEGLAAVQISDKSGFIDTAGNIAIKVEFPDAGYFPGEFSEGLAFVNLHDFTEGCIDKAGKTVFELPPATLGGQFSEGLSVIVDVSSGLDPAEGYVNTAGEIVAAPTYMVASPFSGGLAAVAKVVSIDGESHWKYGFIDKMMNIVIELQYDDAANFVEGLAIIGLGSKLGFINKAGEVIIEPQFERPKPELSHAVLGFSEGLAAVMLGGMWGYIDETGAFNIKPQFEEAWNFSEGLARVRVGNEHGYIDPSGKVVIKPQFVEASDFIDGLAMIGNKEAYIDKTGSYVWQA